MKIIGIIPARYQSSRFPGKPLADICGRPMIWWVYHQAKKVKGLSEVYVATDDNRVAAVCSDYGLDCVMTSNSCTTSTERLYEVSLKIDADLYVCINGDEPLIDPKVIEAVIPTSVSAEDFYVGNIMSPIHDPVEAIDFTNIKVVTDESGNALFMSRSPIPYPKSSMDYQYYKHIGVLIYTRSALKFFAETSRGKNESVEDINELRFIEHGKKLKMTAVEVRSLSVDTPKDLERVREIICEQKKNEATTNKIAKSGGGGTLLKIVILCNRDGLDSLREWGNAA